MLSKSFPIGSLVLILSLHSLQALTSEDSRYLSSLILMLLSNKVDFIAEM